MDIGYVIKLGEAIKQGGVYVGLALALCVIGYLFARNQTLHKQLLDNVIAAHAALKLQSDQHLATAKELAPLASDMVRVIQRLNEIEALYGKKTLRKAAGGGGSDSNSPR